MSVGVSHYENSKKNRLLSCFLKEKKPSLVQKWCRGMTKRTRERVAKAKRAGLSRMMRVGNQYLVVPATSASPERFFSRVGLVQTDLRGSLLDTTMIDLMWAKQVP